MTTVKPPYHPEAYKVAAIRDHGQEGEEDSNKKCAEVETVEEEDKLSLVSE